MVTGKATQQMPVDLKQVNSTPKASQQVKVFWVLDFFDPVVFMKTGD